MTELFIYYRAQADRAEALCREVRAMQDRLRRDHPHLTARLLRRPAVSDGRHTWMEIYACAATAATECTPPLAAIEAEAAGLAALIDGPRHVETFIDIGAACAC